MSQLPWKENECYISEADPPKRQVRAHEKQESAWEQLVWIY